MVKSTYVYHFQWGVVFPPSFWRINSTNELFHTHRHECPWKKNRSPWLTFFRKRTSSARHPNYSRVLQIWTVFLATRFFTTCPIFGNYSRRRGGTFGTMSLSEIGPRVEFLPGLVYRKLLDANSHPKNENYPESGIGFTYQNIWWLASIALKVSNSRSDKKRKNQNLYWQIFS